MFLALAYVLAVIASVVLIAALVATLGMPWAARLSLKRKASQPLLFTAFVGGLQNWGVLLLFVWGGLLILHFFADFHLDSTQVILGLVINIVSSIVMNHWQGYHDASWQKLHDALGASIPDSDARRPTYNEQHGFLIAGSGDKRQIALVKILAAG